MKRGGVPRMSTEVDMEGPNEGYVRVVYVEGRVDRRPSLHYARFRVYDVPRAMHPRFERAADPSSWLDDHAIFRYADQGMFDVMV